MNVSSGNYRQWTDDAACNGQDPDLWCETGNGQHTRITALQMCQRCPVRRQCLQACLNERPRDIDTIRGGTLPSHRRHRNPDRMIAAADRHLDRLIQRRQAPPPPPKPPPPPPMGTDELIHHYAHVHGVTVEDIRSRDRRRPLINARRDIVVALRNAGQSLPAIGKLLNRHHTTVLHHLRQEHAA